MTSKIELLSNEEMQQADRLTIDSGTSGLELMTRAGAAIAELVQRLVGAKAVIHVVCGPGNNGGDGFIAAKILRDQGFHVVVGCLVNINALQGDAALAALYWGGPILDADAINLDRADLIVDALFGSGLSRPPEGVAKAIIERINAAQCLILSVDVPSGLDGNTGHAEGCCIKAHHTITFARFKPGHFLLPGKTLCGMLHLADIHISDLVIAGLSPQTFQNQQLLWQHQFPQPLQEGHKYFRGHALMISGPAFQTGAIRLAARGALRIGAGLVTIAAPFKAIPEHASQLNAIMLKGFKGSNGLAELLKDSRLNAVCMGPGLGHGPSTRELVKVALNTGRQVVLDADALTSFAGDAQALADLKGDARLVITPHEGEFAKLFQGHSNISEQITKAGSKLEIARLAAHMLQCIVVLKGADTVIASPDGRAAINATGTPYLATAGSGDVLAGFITGLMAQNMPSFEAACAGVYIHGLAGEAVGAGLISEDLPEQMPKIMAGLLSTL